MTTRSTWTAVLAFVVALAVALWLVDTAPDASVESLRRSDVERGEPGSPPSAPLAPATVVDDARPLEPAPAATGPRPHRVVVVDPEGARLDGAAVVWVHDPDGVPHEAVTDEEGVATFELTPGSHGWVAVNWYGALSGYGRHQRELTVGDGDTRVVLPRTDGALHALVLDDVGVGVGGVTVSFDGPVGALREGEFVTDAYGAITVRDVIPGAWSLSLDDVPPGHSDAERRAVTVNVPPAGSASGELRVERWGTVVVDVSALPGHASERRVFVHRDGVWRDDPDDATLVYDMPAGMFFAGAEWGPSSRFATPRVIGTVAPGERVRVELEAHEAGVPIGGRVVDEFGRPVARAMLYWTWRTADGGRLSRSAFADARGLFELLGVLGDADVAVAVAGDDVRCARHAPVDVRVDGPLAGVEFELPIGRTLRVTIDDAPRAVEELHLAGVRLDHPHARVEERAFDESGSGVWMLQRVPAGTHELRVEFADGEAVVAGNVLLGLSGPARVDRTASAVEIRVDVVDP